MLLPAESPSRGQDYLTLSCLFRLSTGLIGVDIANDPVLNAQIILLIVSLLPPGSLAVRLRRMDRRRRPGLTMPPQSTKVVQVTFVVVTNVVTTTVNRGIRWPLIR